MMNNLLVKQETTKLNSTILDISTHSSDSDSSGLSKSGFSVKSVLGDVNRDEERALKRPKIENVVNSDAVPIGFLDPLPLQVRMALAEPVPESENRNTRSCKQFWKAGDYEGRGGIGGDSASYSVGMDHVRVHPRFLHSNATSHKWALGAFAELLDNSLDETCNGATYAKVDMLTNKKDGTKMLLVKDNGGGMSPDKMRQCMSLGYSEKNKSANTIGQYGNGFKTSTMRLGADVIVFSLCRGKNGMSPTQSIGLLSYTFLRDTGKEDIVVPIVDYEKSGRQWNKIIRTSPEDWDRNLETLVQWSPYESEEDLVKQFDVLRDQGTRMVIYNLWEDDQGQLELDFDTNTNDIQIRGVNRDEKKIEMAKKYPNSRHFLTYQHSLRSYASILYLRLPPGFRIILRGKDVDHHNLVNDMMMSQNIVYKPMAVADMVPNCSNMLATVTVGFVKDARDHIDIQGFNVYHKNRLIKPFWRVWNAAGSDGRGVIGVLEANFVEPAHDKQGFERTTVLSRLEARLIVMQKQYWSSKCQEIGYAPRRHKSSNSDKEYSPPSSSKPSLHSNRKGGSRSNEWSWKKPIKKSVKGLPPSEGQNKVERTAIPIAACSYSKGGVDSGEDSLKEKSEPVVAELVEKLQFERDRCKSLETQLQEAQQKIQNMDKEQETLIDIFQEERSRRDEGEENMRKRMEDASKTVEELLGKLKRLEHTRMKSCKVER